MPSNPDSGFHFRDMNLAQYYDRNYGRSQRSIAAKQNIERYRWLMEAELKRVILTKVEAVTLWNALNGCNTSHVETLGILRNAVISEIAEVSQDNLQLQNLKGIVAAMSPGQWIAVIDACDRVGGGKYHVEDLGAELVKVGLIEDVSFRSDA